VYTLGGSGGLFKVTPGQSIQAAVDAASPGGTIRVMPGDYIEQHAGTAAVRITKPLKLLAKSRLPKAKVPSCRAPVRSTASSSNLQTRAIPMWSA
jgi:hypothetical protein